MKIELSDASLFLSVLCICLLFCLLWAVYTARRRQKKLTHQLRLATWISEIQQTLFDTYRNPSCIDAGLQKTSQFLHAETVFLISLNDLVVQNLHICGANAEDCETLLKGCNLKQLFPEISTKLFHGESMILQRRELAELSLPDKYQPENLMIVPVTNSYGHLKGILGGIHVDLKIGDIDLLKATAPYFMTAMSNLESYHMIQKMGTTDALTGLANRNAYQQFLLHNDQINADSICCLYIDANGLHELNNHLGHAAGDQMLISIGQKIQALFSSDYCFRIGGDEFVTFCINLSEEEAHKKASLLELELDKQSYHVSIGLSWQNSSWNLESLTTEAEHAMYLAKEQYYRECGDVSKAREMNFKLEKILQEKRDADTFLSIISSYFMGVYVVNLNTDNARIIYLPSYFNEILKENNHKFKKAMTSYINTFVLEDERTDFLAFIDYPLIIRQLLTKKTLEYHYHRTDGKYLFLRICQAEDYGEQKKEAFWIFEEHQ